MRIGSISQFRPSQVLPQVGKGLNFNLKKPLVSINEDLQVPLCILSQFLPFSEHLKFGTISSLFEGKIV